MLDTYEKAQKYLPLTEATYYILISLTEPLHGYGIMQNVDGISGGSVKLGPGTLYGAITKLLKEGLITPAEGLDTADERRKCYVLTGLGKQVIKLEYKRMSDLIENSKSMIYKIGGID